MPLVDDQRHDACGLALPHAAAVDPFLPAGMAIDVAPVGFVPCVDRRGVELSAVDGQAVGDVVARRVGPPAVLPRAIDGVVDAEGDVAVVPGGLIAAGTGLDVQGEAPAPPGIEQADDVADRVVDDRVGVDPRGEREIPLRQPERFGVGNLDPRAAAVEPARLQVDAVVDAVMAASGRIAAVAPQLPVPHESVREAGGGMAFRLAACGCAAGHAVKSRAGQSRGQQERRLRAGGRQVVHDGGSPAAVRGQRRPAVYRGGRAADGRRGRPLGPACPAALAGPLAELLADGTDRTANGSSATV